MSTMVSTRKMKDAEWAKEMRVRQKHPADIPWIHKGDIEKRRTMRLSQLALSVSSGEGDEGV